MTLKNVTKYTAKIYRNISLDYVFLTRKYNNLSKMQ